MLVNKSKLYFFNYLYHKDYMLVITLIHMENYVFTFVIMLTNIKYIFFVSVG